MFRDEDHYSRRFWVNWSHRVESARAIALRVSDAATRLVELDLGFEKLWPMLDESEPDNRFDAHAGKFEGLSTEEVRKLYDQLVESGDLPGPPPDFGPLSELSVETLTELIDARARFDPPPPPQPVSGGGYAFSLASEPPDSEPEDDLWCHVQLHVGQYRGSSFNSVQLALHNDHPLWRDVDLGVKVLHALTESWDAETAAASGHVYPKPASPHDDPPSYQRPWLAWRKEPGRRWSRQVYGASEPWPFPFERAGAPDAVRQQFGGELQVWL